jgi:hypothetical protein
LPHSVIRLEREGVFVEVAVQFITALIALAALVVSSMVARRQTAIQERLAAIEEARRAEELEARTVARVTVSMGRPLDPHLVLRNHGPAVAHGVELEVPEGPHIPLVRGVTEALPADLLPDQELAFAVPVDLATTRVFRVTVRWTDGAGEHEEQVVLQIS